MKKKKTIYIVIILFGGTLLILMLLYGIRMIVSPSLEPGEYQTFTIDRGPVIRFIPAKGTVVPENEVVILSPARSVIQKIVREAGSRVNPGDVILILDPKPIRDDIEKIEDQLEVMRNNLQKNRLSARGVRIDLSYNVEVAKLKIASLKSELTDQEQLLEVGGISPAAYDKTKQELALAEKDLEMVLEKNSIRLKQLEAEEEGLLLQIEIQEKELEDKREVLQKMVVRAASAGIILSINAQEGARVDADQLLVRMSNLTTFKINGSLGEEHAEVVKTGGQVYVTIDDERLTGRIGNIKPLIENNQLQFDIFLKESNHPKLISNLNVTLLVVVEKRDSVLRSLNSTVFGRGDKHEVFVLESADRAARKEIITGLKGSEYIEVVSGAHEGDQIITSEIPGFRRRKEIEIRNK